MAKKPRPLAKVDDAIRRPAATKFGITSASAVVALSMAALWWSRTSRIAPQDTAPVPADTGKGEVPDGLGPQQMQAQQPLVSRLLEMLQEIEQFKDEDNKAERRKVSARVAAELNSIEASLGGKSVVDKQSAALISVVRSALDADADGWKDEDWNDEALAKQHGFVTYASQAYWDEAYADNRYGDSYDWYGAWSERGLEGASIGDVVRPLIGKDNHVLMLGCGNSNMSVLMHEEGYTHITNVDISAPVIDQMRKTYGHIEGLSWHAMDASALSFANRSFDTVIEKGLFDALFAGTGVLAQSVLAEVRRILRPGGSLISITFSGQRLSDILLGRGEQDHDLNHDGNLSCGVEGQIQYPKAKRSHDEKGNGQTFFVYKCIRHVS